VQNATVGIPPDLRKVQDPATVTSDKLTAESATLQVMLEPGRLVRRIYVARLSLAGAIFLAAIFVWQRADQVSTLLASLAFATAMMFTVASAWFTEVKRRPPLRAFLMGQASFDLALVTAVVHVTGGSASQFAALYILVIAIYALLLSARGTTLIAALGSLLYFADVFVLSETTLAPEVLLQLVVFGVVAVSSGLISARLREAGAGRVEALAAELVAARLQAADVLHNIRSGVVTIDDAGRLLYANPAAGALLGIPLDDDAIGRPVLDVIAPVAPELARALEHTVASRIRTTRAEGRIVSPRGGFPVAITTTWFEGTGRGASAATAIFQDASDQKQLEALHLRAERLEAVAELSASLAHEIKNPLASIRSAVEQLAHAPEDADDRGTLSALIVRESDRLSRLLSEFLDFARVRVTQVTEVDLGGIARGATGLVAAHPDRRENVSIRCAAPTEPIFVEGDEDLLHRVVFNLALNAVQAAPASGSVTIEVAPIPADETPGDLLFDRGAVALRVSDDGPGIPDAIRDRLFDPFTTTKPGGSGLGLAVVHRAIEAHKGLVFVDSTAKGTRFTVLLPRLQADAGVRP
jgi:two-component system sensor histidine kinase PilS (NtrC family)